MTLVLLSDALAYRPFLEPLPIRGAAWWLLIIPLALGVSVVYKAVRARTLERYWIGVAAMTTQIIVVMVLLAVGVHVLVEFVIPMLT